MPPMSWMPFTSRGPRSHCAMPWQSLSRKALLRQARGNFIAHSRPIDRGAESDLISLHCSDLSAAAYREARMKCSRCQHENPADALFCQECGKRLEVACPGCGTANQLGAKFCKKCGQPVARMPAVAAAAKSPSPESYTPKHLAEKILTSKSALEGERKQVTVLFADLKSSMELLADPRSRGSAQDPRPCDRAHDGGRPSPRGACSAGSTSTRMKCSAWAARPSRSAWGSARAMWSCARSAAICTWTTRPSGQDLGPESGPRGVNVHLHDSGANELIL